jgi:HEAT repeats
MRTQLMVVVLALFSVSFADIVPTPGTVAVDPVYARADLVCAGAVRNISVLSERRVDTGTQPASQRRMLARVEVSDVYKGTVAANELIAIEYVQEVPSTRGDLPVLYPGTFELLFLTRSPDGSFTFAEPYISAIALQAQPPSVPGTGIGKLQSALVAVAVAGNSSETLNIMYLLQGMRDLPMRAQKHLAQLIESQTPEVALCAAGLLVQSHYPGAIALVRKLLDRLGTDFNSLPLVNLATRISEIRDARAVPDLRILAKSRNVNLRIAAMEAIRSFRDPANAPLLIGRLGDNDKEVQYLAVIALAETFGKIGEYGPSMYLFDKDPGRYTSLWKNWWAENHSRYVSRQ